MNILLIEDDKLFAMNIKMMLECMENLSVTHFMSTNDANTYLSLNQVDIIISDIHLQDGICFQLDEWFKKITTIFLTAVEDVKMQEMAVIYPNSFFLIKPFHELTLKGILDKIKIESDIKKNASNGIEVIGKHRQKKLIPFVEIMWIETEGNYSTINCLDKKYTFKVSMPKLMTQAPDFIIQVHKSFALNVKMINRVDLGQNMAFVNGNIIPIGRKYRKDFLQNIEI